eukprot:7385673-Prymnesium_polylepis.1
MGNPQEGRTYMIYIRDAHTAWNHLQALKFRRLTRCRTLEVAIIGNLRRTRHGPPNYGKHLTVTPLLDQN